MAEKGFTEFYMDDFLSPWDAVGNISKPIIAAVSGFALGGGCELALLCDFIIASEDAQFGQPEIKLGILPGIGGSQRWARSAGKALAMDVALTGRNVEAHEAKAAGIVARVVPQEDLLQEALEAAHTIAGYNAPAVKMAKSAVNAAFEGPLSAGLKTERLFFQAAFATDGQKGHERLRPQTRPRLPQSLEGRNPNLPTGHSANYKRCGFSFSSENHQAPKPRCHTFCCSR